MTDSISYHFSNVSKEESVSDNKYKKVASLSKLAVKPAHKLLLTLGCMENYILGIDCSPFAISFGNSPVF